MLFRVSMAILKHHGEALVSQPETLSVMRYLKSCTKLLFDADGLLKVGLLWQPFPTRGESPFGGFIFRGKMRSQIGI